jgi:hypothetical protein
VARHGGIQEIHESERLSQILEAFYLEIKSDRESTMSRDFFRRNYREKILAVSLAIALWFVLVHEARTVYRTYTIPVQSAELLSGLVVTQISPEEIAVTLSGQRKSFYFLGGDDVKLILKPWQLKEGKTTVRLSSSDFSIPESFEYENAEPREVRVTIASKADKHADANKK